jgi:hypothetical protein
MQAKFPDREIHSHFPLVCIEISRTGCSKARDFANVEEGGSRKQQLQHLVLNAGILQETQWIAFSEKALGILGINRPFNDTNQ